MTWRVSARQAWRETATTVGRAAANMSWRNDAKCRGLDPDMFYPRPNEKPLELAAKRVCAQCDVREECLAYATVFESDGIWGGMTDAERRQAAGRKPRRKSRSS